MAKGSIAKEAIVKKIAEAFGDDYIGEFDKKYYFWATENGERIQIAMSLTCPKNLVNAETAVRNELLDGGAFSIDAGARPQVDISEEEKQNLINLMERLGL